MAYGKTSIPLCTIAPQLYTTFGTYPSRSLLLGVRSGLRSLPMTLDGSSRSSKKAPIEYFRDAPTPWLSTNQPASVSIGEPQLPICTNSHGEVGLSNNCDLSQKCNASENIKKIFSLSCRLNIK